MNDIEYLMKKISIIAFVVFLLTVLIYRHVGFMWSLYISSFIGVFHIFVFVFLCKHFYCDKKHENYYKNRFIAIIFSVAIMSIFLFTYHMYLIATLSICIAGLALYVLTDYAGCEVMRHERKMMSYRIVGMQVTIMVLTLIAALTYTFEGSVHRQYISMILLVMVMYMYFYPMHEVRKKMMHEMRYEIFEKHPDEDYFVQYEVPRIPLYVYRIFLHKAQKILRLK